MLNRGLAVMGTGIDFNTLVARISQQLAPTMAEAPSSGKEQIIHMEVLKNRFSPNKFTLRKGVPVEWVIDAKELNECNKEIVVPEYGLKIKLHPGKQVIEFTPTKAGVVPWSCWMGMIPGTFIVVENKPEPEHKEIANAAQPSEKDIPANETRLHRLIREFRQMWQRLWSTYLGLLAG